VFANNNVAAENLPLLVKSRSESQAKKVFEKRERKFCALKAGGEKRNGGQGLRLMVSFGYRECRKAQLAVGSPISDLGLVISVWATLATATATVATTAAVATATAAVTTVAAATVTTTTAAATGAWGIFARARFVARNATSCDFLLIQTFNRCLCFFGIWHFYEREPTGTTCFPFGDDTNFSDLAKTAESLTDFVFRRAERQVPNKNIRH
jgi:hypothetical protein